MKPDLKRINAIAEHIGSGLSVFITDSGNGSSIGTADMVHMHARELVKNVLIEECLGGSIRFISEHECVVSGEVNFDEVGEALLRDLEPIYAASDAIKEKSAKDDAINLKPRVDDGDSYFKWREWEVGEIPRNVHHLVRVSDSDTNFTCGHVYKVSELKMNDGYVAIKTSFGLDVMFSNKLAKSKFRPAI